MDFDFIPSNDLGSDLDVSSPFGDRNKIYDPGICIEVESTRILATLSPVIDTLLPFSSKNDDKVFNHGVLASKEKSPPFSSHRGFKASKLFHQKSPMLIHEDNTPNLDEEEAIKVTEKKNLENDIVDETLEVDEIINIKESRNHPLENVIGNWYRIFTKGQKTKPNRTKPSTDL
ncbi:hypothetical protein Tco_1122563 [Tanacetum coccineum]|uniref:Uncharacterized protein n=1 Tax=Tanacetum coccineum TaxID=301880 RepID=A0ABQ5J3H2_9ASTR